VVDPKKRKDKHKENEAIQFGFDLNNDNPDNVAREMVKKYLFVSLNFEVD
jgi:WNK lysine deficient protein kinase